MPFLIIKAQAIASTPPEAPSKWPTMLFVLEVANRRHLAQVMRSLRRLNDVQNAEDEVMRMPSRRAEHERGVALRSEVDRLLGRRAELAAVDEALAGLDRRQGTVIAFSGEGGIGKTRLLDELMARASAAGALVLSGRASELERELPFGAWSATSCPSWPR